VEQIALVTMAVLVAVVRKLEKMVARVTPLPQALRRVMMAAMLLVLAKQPGVVAQAKLESRLAALLAVSAVMVRQMLLLALQ
jgi:hypothetical protein